MFSPDYNYHLPSQLIAHKPASPRDSSRLLVIDKQTGKLSHHVFRELPFLLKPSDVLVFNNTAVFPARLHGTKTTGGKVEILLLNNIKKDLWEVISHPGIKTGQVINFPSRLSGFVESANHINLVSNNRKFTVTELIGRIGLTPLPPYIHSPASETILRRQYQTIYAKSPGSAAAPTAGLHFTPRLLSRLLAQKIQFEHLTLHVGLGTFKSPTPEQISRGKLHTEWFTLSSKTAARLNTAKASGRRIIAVGTTTTRVLETCSDRNGRLKPASGQTDIFIKPPYQFKFTTGMITNFHLPKSSLLMLVSAMSSPQIIHHAYQTATKNKYRFYSFGDACLII